MISTLSPRSGGPWAGRAWALCAGLAAGLAHPPFGVLPGLLGYALLLVLLDVEAPRPLRAAFFRGWLSGLGYFAIGVWWVVEAFLVDVAAHGWMAPFALVLLAGGLALFWGLAAVVYRWLAPRNLLRVLVFAGAFAGLEWVRGHIFTGFPWNLPGETWAAGSAPFSRSASQTVYPRAIKNETTICAACDVTIATPRWNSRLRGNGGARRNA